MLPGSVCLALWGLLAGGVAVFLGALQFGPRTHRQKLGQIAGLALLDVYKRQPQGGLRRLQLADDLAHADRGILLRQHVGEVDLDGAQQVSQRPGLTTAS